MLTLLYVLICTRFRRRWNRNWRWHKDLRLWITKESGSAPSQKVQGGEQGLYTFWDPETWQKERKDMTVVYADLEEKSTPANTGLMPTPIGQTPGPTQQHAQPTPLGAQLPNQVATAQRGSFQMGVAGTSVGSSPDPTSLTPLTIFAA